MPITDIIILIILIGVVVLVATSLIGIICSDIANDRALEKIREQFIIAKQRKSYPRFNVSEYAKRREKLLLELEEEKQSQPKYQVTLWLGFDGLQINEDGSWEWISRKPKEVSYSPTFSEGMANYNWNTNVIQSFAQRRKELLMQQTQSTQSYIDYLQAQNQNMQFQMAQQRLYEQINVACSPKYQYLMAQNVYPIYGYNPACCVNVPCIPAKTIR